VGAITSLALSGQYGLIATTVRGDWLTFDLENGGLERMTAVGVAPMQGAPGRPSSIAAVYRWLFVAFPDQREVARYELATCGMSAKAAALLTISGATLANVIVDGAYTYMGLVGQSGPDVVDAFLTPYGPHSVALANSDLPSLRGYRLRALTNPAQIVPYIIAVWRSDSGARTIIQQIHAPNWDDVRSEGELPEVVEVARLPQPVASAASIYDFDTQQTWLFLAVETGRPGVVDLYAFSSDERLADPTPNVPRPDRR